MKALDIRKSHTVVVYETGQGWWASRAAFVFRSMGHPNVRVLDGQFAKWTKEGKPCEVDTQIAQDSDFAYVYDGTDVMNYDDIVKVRDDHSAQILDSRPAGGFSAGNIPGSVNVPTPTLYGEDGCLKSAEELKAIFEGASVDLSKPVVFSCGGGVMATVARAAAYKAGATG